MLNTLLKVRHAAIFVLLAVVLAGCGGSSSSTNAVSVQTLSPATPSSLTLSPATPSIARGTTVQLKATAGFTDGTSSDVTSSVNWASSDLNTATVTQGGLVSGAAVGTSVITAKWGTLSTNTVVTVTNATLASIAVTPASGSVAVRATLQMTATGTFSDASTQDLTTQVTWGPSSGAAVVSNATKGLATGVSVGQATVTATLDGIAGSTSLNVTPPPTFSGKWIELGPKPQYMASQLTANISGRITCMLPIGVTSLLVGTGSGGVWKTTDNGHSWYPITDDQPSLAIGALARDPNHPQVILAGTGEGNNFGANADSPFSSKSRAGVGILKSTDLGKTWSLMTGSTVFARMAITRIAYDPQDATSQRIFVATTQGAFGGPNQPFGLYLSSDGGQSFKKLSTGAAGMLPLNLSVMDLVFQPGDSQVMLASVLSTDANDGIWRSADGGATWNATTVVSNTYGRIALAAAPTDVAPNPGYFYALVGDANLNDFVGVYGSNDNGVTWNSLFSVNTGTTQGNNKDINIMQQSGYNIAIAVDNYADSSIYLAAGEVVRVDGIDISGQTYTQAVRMSQGFWDAFGNVTGGLANSPHVDVHAVMIDQNLNLLIGCDGGLWSLTNPGVSPAFPQAVLLNMNGSDTTGFHNLATTQMYGISMDPTNAFGWAGLQDNGNSYFNNALTWIEPTSGDGGIPLIDPTNPDRQWQVFNSGSPLLSTDGGANFTTFGDGSVYDKNEASTFPQLPLTHTPDGTGTRIATARQSVYEVLPGATNYVNASNGPLVGGNDVVTVLAYAPGNADVLYAGTSHGHVFVRTQAGGAFNDVSTGLPAKVVTPPLISGLSVDPRDPLHAFCTVSAYDVGHVFETTNGGLQWTDISGNLPNVPADCVQALVLNNSTFHDQPILFVGTDSGLYFSQDDGATWSLTGTGLPRVPVSFIDVNSKKGILTLATYGRGAWQISLDPQSPLSAPTAKSTASRPVPTGKVPMPPLPPNPKR